MAGYSSMQLTIRELNKRGWRWGIVERFVHNRRPFCAGRRCDLFGMFDLIVMTENDIVGLQTSKNDYASHYRKITIEKRKDALMWLTRGGKIEIWDWRKLLTKRGGKARTWQPKIREITVRDLLPRKMEENVSTATIVAGSALIIGAAIRR